MKCPLVADDSDPRIKRCPRCSREVVSPHPPHKCHFTCKRLGLGDYVALGLAAFGIKPKKNCGCKERQAAMNSAGAKLGL